MRMRCPTSTSTGSGFLAVIILLLLPDILIRMPQWAADYQDPIGDGTTTGGIAEWNRRPSNATGPRPVNFPAAKSAAADLAKPYGQPPFRDHTVFLRTIAGGRAPSWAMARNDQTRAIVLSTLLRRGPPGYHRR